MKEIIGKKIKQLRTSNNLSQNDFSKKINVTQASLSLYENGAKLPTIDVLVKIVKYFKVSLDWLCGLEPQTNFYTCADLITMLLAIKEKYNINYDMKVDRNFFDPGLQKYTTILTFAGDTESMLQLYPKNTYDNNLLGQFIEEYIELENKLNSLGDNELSSDYKKMWLEKKLLEYSKYKIVNPED